MKLAHFVGEVPYSSKFREIININKTVVNKRQYLNLMTVVFFF